MNLRMLPHRDSKSSLNIFDQVPPEVMFHILQYLNPSDLIRLGQVSRGLRCYCSIPFIWKKKCLEAGLTVHELNPNDYKRRMVKKMRLDLAWRRGQLNKPKILAGHTENVTMLGSINSNTFVSVSWDKTVRIWNNVKTTPLLTLDAHSEIMSDIRNDTCGNVITSSYDGTIKIWNPTYGTLLRTLYGHYEGVICIDVFQNIIVSGSRDRRVIMWDSNTGEKLRVFTEHPAIVNFVKFNGTFLVSGDDRGNVRIWSKDSEKMLKCHSTFIASIIIRDHLIVTLSNEKMVCVHNMKSSQCNHSILTTRSSPGKGQHLDNLLVLAEDKFTLRLWDIETGQPVRFLDGHGRHEGAICSVAIYNSMIFTSGCDGKVKIWDSTDGSFIRDVLELTDHFLTNLIVTESTLIGVRHQSQRGNYKDIVCLKLKMKH